MGSADPALQQRAPWSHQAALFLLSAVVLALQVVLSRILAIASWHHFVYFVISTALLGFGLSGTVLAFAGQRLLRRFRASLVGFSLAAAWLVPLSLTLASLLPLDARYVLYDPAQAGLLLLYHLLLLLPFLAGALVIGLALMRYSGDAPRVYAANLAGSGAGALLPLLLLHLLAPEGALFAIALLAVLAALLWGLDSLPGRPGTPRRTVATAATLLLAAGAVLAAWQVRTPQVDPYKFIATLQRWQEQGDAALLATRQSPRARLDLYASPRLHQTLFAGLTATEPPPEQLMLLADGDPAGTIFRIDGAREAGILAHTPQSLPYAAVDSPRVLLLGEAGGVNVWLARRYDARSITVVQRNPQIPGLVAGLPDSAGGRGLRGPDLRVVVEDPRLFLQQSEERYDIIQLSDVEGLAAGVSGQLGLHENRLLTVQGLARCLARLAPGGMVLVARGLQSPPRDNPRLLHTFAEAIRGEEGDPGRRLLQAHNYLAAVTLAFAEAPDSARLARLHLRALQLGLERDWWPAEAPARKRGDGGTDELGEGEASLRSLAGLLLGPQREELLARYAYDLRAPTDDRPYFFQFFRWRSLPLFLESYGRAWLQRAELGYMVAVVVFAEATLLGLLFVLLPGLRLGRGGRAEGRLAVVLFFGALGGGYLLVEMVLIQNLTLLFGDPTWATAWTLAALLLLSGAGSWSARRGGGASRTFLADAGFAALLVLTAFGVLAAGREALFALPLAGRLLLTTLVVAPLAFVLGRPFPRALALLGAGRPALVPLAWAANGFASVAAAPLAVLLAVQTGYLAVAAFAALLYLAVALLWRLLPRA